jgi:hypothetical protein
VVDVASFVLLGTYFLKPLLQLFPGRGVGAEALEPVIQLAANVTKFICGQRIQRMRRGDRISGHDSTLDM